MNYEELRNELSRTTDPTRVYLIRRLMKKQKQKPIKQKKQVEQPPNDDLLDDLIQEDPEDPLDELIEDRSDLTKRDSVNTNLVDRMQNDISIRQTEKSKQFKHLYD